MTPAKQEDLFAFGVGLLILAFWAFLIIMA
jgi:hypothetical protein